VSQSVGIAVQDVAGRTLVLQCHKRPWSATVLGWLRARATNADRVDALPVPREPAFHTEAMQVGVVPAHDDLQGIKEGGYGAITAHQVPAPDQG
jgi:hypothetical protein